MKRFYNHGKTVANQARSNVVNNKGTTRGGVITLITQFVYWMIVGEVPDPAITTGALTLILT